MIGLNPANSAEDSPFSGEIVYKGQGWNVASGGLAQGSAYLHNIDVSLEWDMSKSGIEGGTLFLYGLANNKSELSADLVGDLQVVSNIDNGEVYRMLEAWYQQEIGNTRFKAGLIDLNSEFDAIDTAGLFLNSSHGIGPDFSQTGEGGPSNFPTTSLAIMFETKVNEQFRIIGGLFDAVPNDPNNPKRHKLAVDEGVIYVGEMEFITSNNIRFALGGYKYSSKLDPLLGGTAQTGHGGVYGTVEAELMDNVSGWLRVGLANSTLNPTSHYVGTGIVLSAPFEGRENDQLGIAIAAAMNGDDFKAQLFNDGSIAADGEYNIELSYRYQINDNLAIQPDVQYIINPGGTKDLKNALVLGIHLKVGFGF